MKIQVLVNNDVNQLNAAKAIRRNDVLTLWHERLGHQNINRVKEIISKMNIKFLNYGFFCESRMLVKKHRLPFKPTGTSGVSPGNLIHTDTCDPMQEKSIGGSRYFVLFKDDCSHYRTIFFIKEKSEVKRVIDKYLKSVKMNTNFDVKVMRNLPIKLWAEATNTAVYILNRTGTGLVKGITPFELWFGQKPQISHLKIFGTKVFTHIPKKSAGNGIARSTNVYNI